MRMVESGRVPGRLIDSARSVRLWDVGGTDLMAAMTVGPNGEDTLWIVDEKQLGRAGTDHGDEKPAHELVGQLPQAVRDRIWKPLRCGRRTRLGRPCRARVLSPGEPCAHHGGQALPLQPDLWDRAEGGG